MEQAPPQLPDDNTLVIGEGVVLDLQPAGVPLRVLSGLIDWTLLIVLYIGALIATLATIDGADGALAAALFLCVTVAVFVALPATVETLTRGSSLARLILGLRVVRDEGGPIRARHAVIRALLAFFEVFIMFGSVAVICSMVNSRGKRLGDLAAGTYVLRERRTPQPVAQIFMPPELAEWARVADIGRLPDDLAMTLRLFLTRLPQLAPYARAQLAADLQRQLYPLVAPGPPPGTHPERFIAAVVAERRERELRRYERERAATARLRQALHG